MIDQSQPWPCWSGAKVNRKVGVGLNPSSVYLAYPLPFWAWNCFPARQGYPLVAGYPGEQEGGLEKDWAQSQVQRKYSTHSVYFVPLAHSSGLWCAWLEAQRYLISLQKDSWEISLEFFDKVYALWNGTTPQALGLSHDCGPVKQRGMDVGGHSSPALRGLCWEVRLRVSGVIGSHTGSEAPHYTL